MSAVPLAVAVAAHVAGGTGAVVSATAPDPLVFEQYQVSLGPIPAVREVGARFAFTNRGKRAVRIVDLKPSCGCLTPQLDKHELEPGESGKFLLRVATAQQDAGLKEFSVDASYREIGEDAGNSPRVVRLTFKAVFPEKQVVVRPRALLFYQLGTQSTSQDVLVIDQRATPLSITAARSSSPAISATLGAAETDSDGHRAYRLQITAAAKVPSGRTRALVTLETDDPAYPTIQVPIMVQGPDDGRSESELASSQGGLPEATPRRLAFQVASGTPTPAETIELRSPAGARVSVLGTESGTGNLTATIGDQRTLASGVTATKLRVTWSGPPPATRIRDVLSVRTDHPQRPRIDVPVTIEPAVRPAGD